MLRRSRRSFLRSSVETSLYGGLLAATGFNSWIRDPNRVSMGKVSPNDTLRLGVIGTGGRGINLMETLQEIAGTEVVACCDILPFRLEKAMEKASKKAKSYIDYRSLLDDQSIDAVIISAPLHLHFEMAKDSLDAGKHVYCEKTMTFTIEEAKKLGSIVENSDKVFQVGYQHRYNKLYSNVKDIINGEDFGTLSHIECYWNRNGDWRRPVPDPKFERIINWRMYREFSGGLMAELTSHQINIVNWMVGATPVKVMGAGGIDYWKDGRETYDNIHVLFEYPDGLKVNCTSLTTNAQMGFQMKFYGKNGSIQIVREDNYNARLWVEPTYLASMTTDQTEEADGTSGATELLKKGDPIPLFAAEAGKEDREPTLYSLQAFADCVRNNKEPLVGYESGKKSAICVALANKAMQTQQIVRWADFV